MDKDESRDEDTFAPMEPSIRESPFTIGRITNGVLAGCCIAAMIACFVCLGVMATKHKQIIDHVRDPGHSDKEGDETTCILFATNGQITLPDNRTVWTARYNHSHACQFVIFGSGLIAAGLLIAAIYYIVRWFVMRSLNPLVMGELAGFIVVSILMFSIAVVASTGRAYTCDHLTNKDSPYTDKKCSDVRLYYDNDPTTNPDEYVTIYSALKTSEVSSWISFLILLALAIASVVRLVIWVMRRSQRRRETRQLESLINPVSADDDDDDDDEPLPM